MLSKEQRDAIGKEIVDGRITTAEATAKYDIALSTAQKFATDYRRTNSLPVRQHSKTAVESNMIKLKTENGSFDLTDYQSMSKAQLIEELMKAKINEARAKKGYEVKGDGQNKEFISLNSRNLKS